MANAFAGNTIYIDSTGDSGLGTGRGNTFLTGIFFTPDAANDALDLRETVGGTVKFYCRAATAKSTVFFDMADTPIRFVGAIHVTTITSGAKAILVWKEGNA